MFLPFTYPWIIRHHLSNKKTILDLGTGDGAFMGGVNSDGKYIITGIEIFVPYIKKAIRTKAYKKIINGDVTNIKIEQKFDVVHASQVIEHLSKASAKKFLSNCDQYSSKLIIIGTPNGHFHQEEYDANVHQTHKSEWSVSDFKKMKYKVYGQGLKLVYGEHGLLQNPVAKLPFMKRLLFLLSYLLSPFTYYFPEYAAHIIAVKKK